MTLDQIADAIVAVAHDPIVLGGAILLGALFVIVSLLR